MIEQVKINAFRQAFLLAGGPIGASDDAIRAGLEAIAERSSTDHRDCLHRHGAYGECPVVPTFEVDPDFCLHERWNPDNRQCLDCGHVTPEDLPPLDSAPAAASQCPTCASPYPYHRFVMPDGPGRTAYCKAEWHREDGTVTSPKPDGGAS